MASRKPPGHQVRIDTPEIKAGEDWRRSIVDGLSDTDGFGAFCRTLRSAIPACLDELAIALHAKGGTIATVLVEGRAEIETPVSVSDIQWLDMHERDDRWAGAMTAVRKSKISRQN